jgi:hypothetical protein
MALVGRSARLVLLVLAACGGSTPPPRPPADKPVEAPAKAAEESEMRVAGQLGSIEPGAVTRSFASAEAALRQCHAKGLKRIRFLGGEIKVALRIGEDGRARYAWFEDTTLGDHDTELCMMHVFLEVTWPTPRGGEAEVKSTFAFDPPSDVPVPEPRQSDAVTAQLATQRTKISACKRSPAEVFRATAYIVDGAKKPQVRGHATPKPKKTKRARTVKPRRPPELRGKIVAVGIAPPGPERDDAVECLTHVVLEMHLESAPRPGKVSFSL